jgi:hypothetical protein
MNLDHVITQCSGNIRFSRYSCAIKPLLRQCRRHSVASRRLVPRRLRLTVSVLFAELNTLLTSADIVGIKRVLKAH